MRGQGRKGLIPPAMVIAAALGIAAVVEMAASDQGPDVEKSSAAERAGRRAYDGAPPVIPHEDFGNDCAECHDREGMQVEGVGFSPPSPHEETGGMSAISRCRQCHVFSVTDEVFTGSGFEGLRQDMRRGRRLSEHSPPVIPHKTFMRENCSACHTGRAAREEIRTTHPERVRCRQCHVPAVTTATFGSEAGG